MTAPITLAMKQASIQSKSWRSFDRFYVLTLTYFWFLQFTRGDSVQLFPVEIGQYLFIVPAAVVSVIGIFYILITSTKLRRPSLILGLFILLFITASVLRGDRETIASLGLLSIAIIVIVETKPITPINYINFLFLLSIPINCILYYFEYSIYTFVPGIGRHPDLWWRVALLPSVAESGLLSLAVFIFNINLRGQQYRIPILVMSAYFVIFSGNRTAMFAALVGGVFVLLRRNRWLIKDAARRTFAITASTLFLLSIFSTNILLALPFANNGFLRALIFRKEDIGQFDVGDQLGTAAIREWIFEHQWAAFLDSPLTGIGTFDFSMLTTGYNVLDNLATGSEAFVTGLLARIGLLSLLFFHAIFLVRHVGMGDEADLSLCAKLALLIGMLTYGSFVNAYDIVFLLLMLGIVGAIHAPETRIERSRAAGEPVVAG